MRARRVLLGVILGVADDRGIRLRGHARRRYRWFDDPPSEPSSAATNVSSTSATADGSRSHPFPSTRTRIDPIVSPTAPPPAPTVAHASPVPVLHCEVHRGSGGNGAPLVQARGLRGLASLRERLEPPLAASLSRGF
jgi:hypothetical protein